MPCLSSAMIWYAYVLIVMELNSAKFALMDKSLKEWHLMQSLRLSKKDPQATAITEGTWGFEHTKACFRDEIIPFIKELKDIFNNFNQYLVEELADVQKVFYQMEQAVEQHRLESRTFECLDLETELVKKKDFVDKETYDNLCKCFTTLEKHCITLEADSQLNHEIFQQENSVLHQNAPSFTQLFELSELKAQSQAKDTVASGSQPSGNTKKDRILQAPSSNSKNKVEAHPRNVKSSLNKKNGTVNVNGSAVVQNLKKQDNSIVKDIWKPTGKVFTQIGYTWRPTGRTFTIVGNACPLTRITTTNEVPSRKPIVLDSESPKLVVKLVYSRKPRKNKNAESVSNTKVVQTSLVFWDFRLLELMSGTLSAHHFIGNVTISRVYYVEGLGHNLFSVGQFCDSNLEVAFRQHTCFIRNLEGVDLLTGSRGDNLYTLSLGNMMASSPIYMDLYEIDPWNGLRKRFPTLSEQIMELSLLIRRHCREYYEKVGISHETSVARSPQQNGVVERRNRTLIEAARTMLIYAKAPLFLWAEAVATACYTQNRSIIRQRHGKTPYELLHNKPPDLSYLHVFGALCYPTNDSENLGKLQPKADIGIFIGYAPTKKAFRIYNRRTRRIIETIHVDFDELTAMASEHSSSGPALHEMTPVSLSSGLVPNPSPSTPFVPPSRSDWDLLFQPMFDESLNVDFHAPEVIAPIPEAVAPEHAVSTGSPSSTTVDQDAPSPSNSHTPQETQTPIISHDVEEDNHDIEVAHMGNDPYFGIPIPEVTSDQSSSSVIIHTIVPPDHHISEHNSKWTKDHPLENIIGALDRPVSTRLQLHEQALFCYYDAFLTSVGLNP
ncbi:putative ribonuclease H-like domain-containing protein [Tanacetum coccineum]